ncbi:MAG: thioredoxin-disulfide reductase [Desulfobacterales bacterium]|jgi:thioredoxin reductase (NADPH)|nr:thioredoxin-disulfide reductase [Desulfobacterales bacterium]
MTQVEYDLLIIGGGPAGLTAGLYAARARLKVLLIEKLVPGGQMVITDRIDNYPGFPEGISGPELSLLMKSQAERFELNIETNEVLSLEITGQVKTVRVSDRAIKSKAIIIATGASPKHLGVPGEAEFWGKGVSTCATCDGPFYTGKTVVAVGGGNTALKESVFLSRFAEKIYLVHRRNSWRAEAIMQERVRAIDKIEPIWNTVLTRIDGEGIVKSATVKNLTTGDTRALNVSACFIWIGIKPNLFSVGNVIGTDKAGFILTDPLMRTSLPGIFAAGDIRSVPTRQIAGAVGDGAMAAHSAQQYIEGNV